MSKIFEDLKEEFESIKKKGYTIVSSGGHVTIVNPENLGEISFDMYTQMSPNCTINFYEYDKNNTTTNS